MMDKFNYAKKIKSDIYSVCIKSRRTGRTMEMINSLKNGDVVVFSSNAEAERVEYLIKKRNINIKSIVINPKNSAKLYETQAGNNRRFIFDHSWVEEYFLNAVDKCEKEISYWQSDVKWP